MTDKSSNALRSLSAFLLFVSSTAHAESVLEEGLRDFVMTEMDRETAQRRLASIGEEFGNLSGEEQVRMYLDFASPNPDRDWVTSRNRERVGYAHMVLAAEAIPRIDVGHIIRSLSSATPDYSPLEIELLMDVVWSVAFQPDAPGPTAAMKACRDLGLERGAPAFRLMFLDDPLTATYFFYLADVTGTIPKDFDVNEVTEDFLALHHYVLDTPHAPDFTPDELDKRLHTYATSDDWVENFYVISLIAKKPDLLSPDIERAIMLRNDKHAREFLQEALERE